MSRILFIILFSVAVIACKDSTVNGKPVTENSTAVNKAVSTGEFEQKLAAPGAQLVDVRTPEEYAEGHLKGAANINVQGDEFDKSVAKLDKTKPVLVYCRSGRRSSAAAAKLQEMGFTEIYNMEGGIEKWQSDGKPAVK